MKLHVRDLVTDLHKGRGGGVKQAARGGSQWQGARQAARGKHGEWTGREQWRG